MSTTENEIAFEIPALPLIAACFYFLSFPNISDTPPIRTAITASAT